MMDDVFAFLRARYAEDESTAREAGGESWRAEIDSSGMATIRRSDGDLLVSSYDDADFRAADAQHITRHTRTTARGGSRDTPARRIAD